MKILYINPIQEFDTRHPPPPQSSVKNFFSKKTVQKYLEPIQLCINKRGDYIEHLIK